MVTRRVAKKIILAKRFDGLPKLSDFQLVEEELRPLKNGEFLAEAVYLSVDPYMRAYASNISLGSVMVGTQIAKIIESQNSKYPEGKFVVGKFDWTTHSIYSENQPNQGRGPASPYIIPEFKGFPLSFALGVLGMPGNTAYFGFLEICKPKPGETVVVSGAAGAVGMIVGQTAKIKGCKVIGITGSDQKGQYLVKSLGFDAFANYKTDDLDKKLEELAPEGVDCYFDNVAGEVSSIVIKHMNTFGRISVCGSISSYNEDIKNVPKVTAVQEFMLLKQLVMEGYQNTLYQDRQKESFDQHLKWLLEGKLKYHETVTEGFDNMPKAFIEMLQGKNLGKAIVKSEKSPVSFICGTKN